MKLVFTSIYSWLIGLATMLLGFSLFSTQGISTLNGARMASLIRNRLRLLAGLRTVIELAKDERERVEWRLYLSTNLFFNSQSSCFPHRAACNRQNFAGCGSVCSDDFICDDGRKLWRRFCFEFAAAEGYKRYNQIAADHRRQTSAGK